MADKDKDAMDLNDISPVGLDDEVSGKGRMVTAVLFQVLVTAVVCW